MRFRPTERVALAIARMMFEPATTRLGVPEIGAARSPHAANLACLHIYVTGATEARDVEAVQWIEATLFRL